MKSEVRDESREPGEAGKLLRAARQSIAGQAMKPETLARVRGHMAEEAVAHDTREAAAFCEEVVAWLNQEWSARGFTPEQCIFSVALATINLRQHFPEERGGKEAFDRVSRSAWEYFRDATERERG